MGSMHILKIDRYVLESILYESWDDFIQDWTGSLQARICIDFYQPNIVTFVYHEVHPEDLEIIESFLGVHAQSRSKDAICCYFLHLWVNDLPEVKATVTFLDEGIQFFIGDFIALLKLAVIRQMFLNCVIG